MTTKELKRAMVKGLMARDQMHLDHLALSEIRCPICNRRFIAKVPNKLFVCRCGLAQLRSSFATELDSPVSPLGRIEIWLHEEEVSNADH